MEKKQAKKSGKLLLIGCIALIAVIAVIALSFFNILPSTGLFAATGDAVPNPNPEQAATASLNPEQFAVRQAYFKEAFQPKREEYKLFEKAAAFLHKPISEMPAYFTLKNEGEIFSSLPPTPKDFGEIAYMLASGRYFAIGNLEGEYYKQPEFYPNFKEYGLKYWSQPDPKYWVTSGYGSYPSDQWDVLERGKREEFTAVVFFYSGWGVQTFQGATLMPDSNSKQYFDISITPQNFLLEPTFPKFYKNWAYKIIIKGKVKPNTQPGPYAIGISIGIPPKELKEKWEFEYRNLYFDAASGIKPSGNQIQLNITVN